MGCGSSKTDAATAAASPAVSLPATLEQTAADLGVDEEKLKCWREWGGGDLEPGLVSGAYVLIDAQWIVDCAANGGVLVHRQALPKEAFISLADLIEASGEYGLKVIALSYPWLSKEHPDPEGANLRRVAQALKAILNDTQPRAHYPNGLRFGVFWDYLSLYQHPSPANGIMRTETEQALFKEGLGCLSAIYGHHNTKVLQLTTFPAGYVKESLPEGTNTSEYLDRGWCYAEQSLSGLVKYGTCLLNLGLMTDEADSTWALIEQCTAGNIRRPPLLPPQFAVELEKKMFTNGKADRPVVNRVYETAFKVQFDTVQGLYYNELGWGDAELAQLSTVIEGTPTSRLEKLWLQGNQIGDEGAKALAAALSKKPALLLRLNEFNLASNHIGNEGLTALAATFGREGGAPNALFLGNNHFGDAGLADLLAALGKQGAATRLEGLTLHGTQISGEGLKALAATLGEGIVPSLKNLGVDSKPPELVAACKKRGIDLSVG